MKSMTVRILLFSLLFAALLWVTGSVYEYLEFEQNLRFMLDQEPLSFVDSLLLRIPPHALFYRIAGAIACLVGGSLVALYFGKFRQRDRALREREALLRAFTGALPDAGFIFDEEGRYVEVMSPPEGLLITAADAKRGRRMHDLFAREQADRFVRLIAATIETGRPQTVEYPVRTADGTRLFEGRTAPIHGVTENGKRLVVWIARDVTDRANLEEQLRQSEKMQAIGQLAGGVAHDFNNQLGGIMGFADLLRERVGEPALVSFAEGIVTSARRAAELTQQLLAFSRKGKFLSVPVNLHAVIEEVIKLLGRSIDKRIRIERDLRADPALATGDPTQITNALLNLALNARDAMPEGGEITFASDLVELDADFGLEGPVDVVPGPYVRLTVRDTGVGMDEETERRMFEPFFTTKGSGQGTGMGLAAVYGTVKAHRGAVRVRTAEGEGTAVEVYLPLATVGESPESEPPEVRSTDGRARVLVVDDEEAIREVASEMLEELGCRAVAVSGGREAVERYGEDPDSIDLVLLDLVMPDLSGKETYAALREIDPGVRVVLSSGYAFGSESEALMQAGARGFLQKPYQIADLGAVVRAALE